MSAIVNLEEKSVAKSDLLVKLTCSLSLEMVVKQCLNLDRGFLARTQYHSPKQSIMRKYKVNFTQVLYLHMIN